MISVEWRGWGSEVGACVEASFRRRMRSVKKLASNATPESQRKTKVKYVREIQSRCDSTFWSGEQHA